MILLLRMPLFCVLLADFRAPLARTNASKYHQGRDFVQEGDRVRSNDAATQARDRYQIPGAGTHRERHGGRRERLPRLEALGHGHRHGAHGVGRFQRGKSSSFFMRSTLFRKRGEIRSAELGRCRFESFFLKNVCFHVIQPVGGSGELPCHHASTARHNSTSTGHRLSTRSSGQSID